MKTFIRCIIKDLIIWLILINAFNYLLIDFTTNVDWVDRNGLKCYANIAQQEHNNYKCHISVFRYETRYETPYPEQRKRYLIIQGGTN